MGAEAKRVELLRMMRGYINPESFLTTLCHVAGITWVASDANEGDVLAGTVDGQPIRITREEWLPLDTRQGLDLVAQRLKEALL